MIDDRVCMFYVADRVEDIVKAANPAKKAEDFLKEMNHNIGINARVKRNNPEKLVADLPPIPKVNKRRGRPKKNG